MAKDTFDPASIFRALDERTKTKAPAALDVGSFQVGMSNGKISNDPGLFEMPKGQKLGGIDNSFAAAVDRILKPTAETRAAERDAIDAAALERVGLTSADMTTASAASAASGARLEVPAQAKWTEITASPQYKNMDFDTQSKQRQLYVEANVNEYKARVAQATGKPVKDSDPRVQQFRQAMETNTKALLGPRPEWSIADSDYWDAAKRGGKSLYQGLRLAFGDQETADDAKAQLREATREWNENKSAYTRNQEKLRARERAAFERENAAQGKEGLTASQEATLGWRSFWDSPIRNILGSAPSMLPTIAVGAATSVLTGGNVVAGGATASGVNALLTAGDVVSQVVDTVDNASPEELAANPVYQRLLAANNGDAARAKNALIDVIADEAKGGAAALGLVAGAATPLLGAGKIAADSLTKVLAKNGFSAATKTGGLGAVNTAMNVAKPGVVRRTAMGIAGEGVQEFVEEGGGQVIGNVAARDAGGFNVGAFDGAVEAGVAGFLAGGGTSVGVQAAGAGASKLLGPKEDNGDVIATANPRATSAQNAMMAARSAKAADASNLAVNRDTGLMRLIDTEDEGRQDPLSAALLAMNSNENVLYGLARTEGQSEQTAQLTAISGARTMLGPNWASTETVNFGPATAPVPVSFRVNGDGTVSFLNSGNLPADLVTAAQAAEQTANEAVARIKPGLETFFGRTRGDIDAPGGNFSAINAPRPAAPAAPNASGAMPTGAGPSSTAVAPAPTEGDGAVAPTPQPAPAQQSSGETPAGDLVRRTYRGTLAGLRGPGAAGVRQRILLAATGETVPVSRAGINAVIDALTVAFGLPVDTAAGTERAIDAALAVEPAPLQQAAQDIEQALARFETALRTLTPPLRVKSKGKVTVSPSIVLSEERLGEVLAAARAALSLGVPSQLLSVFTSGGQVKRKFIASVILRVGAFSIGTQWKETSSDTRTGTLVHEMGHVLDDKLSDVSQSAAWAAPFAELKAAYERGELRVLAYPFGGQYKSMTVATKRSEAFAMAVELYFTDTDALLASAPFAHRAVAQALADYQGLQNGRPAVSNNVAPTAAANGATNTGANRGLVRQSSVNPSGAGQPRGADRTEPGAAAGQSQPQVTVTPRPSAEIRAEIDRRLADGSMTTERAATLQRELTLAADREYAAGLGVDIDADNIQDRQDARTPADALMAAQAGVTASPATPQRGITQALTDSTLSRQARLDRAKPFFATMGDKLVERFVDALVPMVRWVQALPLPKEAVNAILGAMYLAPNVRDSIIGRAQSEHGGDELNAALSQMLADGRKSNAQLTAETVIRDAGYWVTARYALIKNQRMLEADQLARDNAEAEWIRLQNDPQATPDEIQGAESAYRSAEAVYEDRQYALSQPATVNTHFGRPLPAGISGPARPVGLAGGMNTAQAQAFMAVAERQFGRAKLEAMASHVYRLNAFRMATDIESSRVAPDQAALFSPELEVLLPEMTALRDTAHNPRSTQQQIERARKKFIDKLAVSSFYVPTTGDPSKGFEQDVLGSGFKTPNVAKDRRLMGRTGSLANDGITASVGGMQRSASAAGWNDFTRAIAQAYDNMTIEQRQDAGMKRVTLTALDRLSDNMVIHGDYGYTIRDGSELNALRKENVEDRSGILRLAEVPTRAFAYGATQLNPLFGVINMGRDIWERSENLRGKQGMLVNARGRDVDTTRAAQRMISLGASGSVLSDLVKSIWQGQDTKYGALLREFEQYGGGGAKYSASLVRDRAALTLDIEAGNSNPRKLLKALGTVVSKWNDVFDSVSAVSAYAALREQGMTKEAAAYAALDLMNFRKSGSFMPFVRALYAFAQPAVTGGANLANLLKTKTGRKRFLGYVALFSLMLPILAGMMGEDDETGRDRMDLLDDYTKDRFLPIPIGDTIIKMPLGFGLPVLANIIARQGLGFAKGETSAGEALLEVAGRGLVPAFTPLEDVKVRFEEDPAAWFAQTFSPTVAKPVTNVAINRGGLGNNIVNEGFMDKTRFQSEQGAPLTAQEYKDIAQGIRSVFSVDMAPEQVRELLRGYAVFAGAAGREALRAMIDNPNRELQGKETPLPFIGTFVANTDNGAIAEMNRFEDRGLAVIREANTQIPAGLSGEEAREARDQVELDPQDRRILDLYESWLESEKELRARSSALTRAGVAPGVNPERMSLREQRDATQARFIREFNQLVGR